MRQGGAVSPRKEGGRQLGLLCPFSRLEGDTWQCKGHASLLAYLALHLFSSNIFPLTFCTFSRKGIDLCPEYLT